MTTHEISSGTLTRLAALVLGAILTISSALAQTSLASLQGKVTDAQGGAVVGAMITARQVETNSVRTGTTNSAGQYLIPNLPAGPYELTVQQPGFATEKRSFILRVGQVQTIDFALKLATVQQTVEVSAKVALVETEHTVGTNIDTKEVDDIPVLNRNFASLALLAPGVSQMDNSSMGFSASGAHQFQNNVIVDGGTNDMHFYGTMADTFPQDWIQEFQVMTNGFSAEYGNASGAVLNVITRSGTNRFHGRGYGFFQNAALNSPPYAGHYVNGQPLFLSSPPPYSQYRVGAYLGGPVIRDKLFFFAGFEDLNNDSTLALAISPYWINRGVQSVIPTSFTLRPFIVKSDWEVNSKNRISARFDRTNETYLNCAGQIGQGCNSSPTWTLEKRATFSGPVWSTTADWTSTLSASAFNEFRVYYGVNEVSIDSNLAHKGGQALLQDTADLGLYSEKTYPGAAFGSSTTGGLEGETNLYFIDNFSLIKGSHQLKFGGQIAALKMIMDIDASQKGRWYFNTDLAFDPANPASYPYQYMLAIGTAKDIETHPGVGLYFLDDWKVSSGLTLNLGVRYDIDYTLTAGNQFVQGFNQRFVASQGGAPPLTQVNPDLKDLAPRLGFSWAPWKARRTTIRGGFGMFYDQGHYNYNDVYLNQTLLTSGVYSFNANNSTQNPFYNAANPAASATQLRAFLASNFPNPPDFSSLKVPPQQIAALAPNLKVPFTEQVSIGVAQDLGANFYLQADYVFAHGRNQLIQQNLNVAPVNGNIYNLAIIDPRFTAFNEQQNLGWTQYNALQTRLEYRGRRWFRGDVSYSLAKTTSDTTATQPGGGASTNPYLLSIDDGPANEDRRHNLSSDALLSFPLGFQLSGIYRYGSALPYSVTDSTIVYRRPEARNDRRGHDFKTADFRLSKVFKIRERLSATGFFEAYNVFNFDNFITYQGSVQSSAFGQPQDELPKRQLQYGFRVDF